MALFRLQYLMKAVGTLREWFRDSIRSRKSEVTKLLQEANGDVETSDLKRDVFTLMALASQQDGKLHLEDSELVGNPFEREKPLLILTIRRLVTFGSWSLPVTKRHPQP
jgi:hypothetical protein